MSEGTVHPLAQPVGRTHASGAFDWRAVPSADPRTSAFALDTAPALPAAAEEFSGEACREIVEDLLDRTRTGAAVAEVHAPFCESKCDGCGCWQHAYKELESRRWADALVREMAAWADTHAQAGAPIQALRFGGGTPSAMEPVDILHVLAKARQYLPLSNDCSIEQKVIRCVGNAEERFGEDALRIMRAVRFSAQLGFTVDPDTAKAAKKLAGTLSKISAERIQTELVKLLVSPHPDYLRYAWEYGITAVVLPEFDRTMETPQNNNPHHCYNVGEHTLEALRNIEADKTLRLAALFHDFGKPQTHTTDADGIDHFHGHAKISAELANDIMHRLKFDNDTLNKVKVYVRYHDLWPELTEKSVRRAVSKVGADAFAEVLKLKMADTLAQSPKWQPEKKAYLKELTALYHTILEKQQCLCIKDLKISGKDLIEDGMKPGKEMGEILAKLLELVLEEPQRNEREWLIGKSRELRNTEG